MDEKRSKAAEQLRLIVAPPRLTQKQLADELSVTQQAVNNWIAGRSKPGRDIAVRLAQRLGIAVEDWTKPVEEPRRRRRTGTEG